MNRLEILFYRYNKNSINLFLNISSKIKLKGPDIFSIKLTTYVFTLFSGRWEIIVESAVAHATGCVQGSARFERRVEKPCD